MTPAEQQIREALEAGPTPGPWHWEADEVKGDPTGRVRYQVTALGKTVTRVYYSSFEGGPTNAEADAKLIAACNPANVAELLAELDGERNRSQMYADIVRGVAVVLHGEGWSDTSKLPEEVAELLAELDRLRAERKPLSFDKLQRGMAAARAGASQGK